MSYERWARRDKRNLQVIAHCSLLIAHGSVPETELCNLSLSKAVWTAHEFLSGKKKKAAKAAALSSTVLPSLGGKWGRITWPSVCLCRCACSYCWLRG